MVFQHPFDLVLTPVEFFLVERLDYLGRRRQSFAENIASENTVRPLAANDQSEPLQAAAETVNRLLRTVLSGITSSARIMLSDSRWLESKARSC